MMEREAAAAARGDLFLIDCVDGLLLHLLVCGVVSESKMGEVPRGC